MLADILGDIFGTLLRAVGAFLFGWLRRPLRFLWRPFGWFFSHLARLFKRYYWLRALCVMLGINLFWLFFIFFTFQLVRSSWDLTYYGASAEGTVVALDERRKTDGVTYAPIVEYNLNGESYRFNSGFASAPPAYRVGERVEILYNPANPHQAEIKAWWSAPALYIALCAIMLGAGLLTNFFMAQKIWRGEPLAD